MANTSASMIPRVPIGRAATGENNPIELRR